MHKLNKNAAGVAAGTVAALVHALLSLGVWASPEVIQKLVNLNIALHFMKVDITVQPFSLGGAIALVVIAFCVGYVVGCILATVYNHFAK
jgi:uncharacterized membrane protein